MIGERGEVYFQRGVEDSCNAKKKNHQKMGELMAWGKNEGDISFKEGLTKGIPTLPKASPIRKKMVERN